MATRTWAGTLSANWNTAGNWVEVAVPTAADDVVIGATGVGNPMTLNIATPVCRSIDFTGYTSTLTIPAATTLTIGDGTAGAGNIAIKIVAGMTVTLGDAATSAVSFISTSATQQTCNFDAKVFGNVTWNAASNGSWQLTSALTATGGTLSLVKGTLDTNGQTISCSVFDSSGSSTRVLTLGASSITVTLLGNAWNLTSTGMTLNANTSTITMAIVGTGTGTFVSGALTYNNIVLNGVASQSISLNGAFSCNNLTFTNPVTNANQFIINANITVTGTFTITSAATARRTFFISNTIGTARTVTCTNAPSLTNADFRDITAAGAGGTWAGTSLGDCGGNSNITFTTPVTRYAVAAGNWSSTAVWSTTNGGGSGASFPLPQDTAYLNNNSGVGTITMDIRRYPAFDCTGAGGGTAYTGTLAYGSLTTDWYGNVALSSAMTLTPGAQVLQFGTRGTNTLTSAGKTFGAITVIGPNAITLNDALTSSGLISVSGTSTLNTGGFSVTSSAFTASGTPTLNLGATVWTVTLTSGTAWQSVTTMTINAGTSEIVLNGGTASSKTFGASSRSYNKVTFSGSGTGVFIITASGTPSFNILAADTPPHTIQFTAGITVAVNTWSIRGVSGSIFTLQSTTGGSAWNLTKTGGKISTDWISLQDSVAAGGAKFYAGRNSTNVSGNTGWLFKMAPDFGFLSMAQ